jgi:hypothetical protein
MCFFMFDHFAYLIVKSSFSIRKSGETSVKSIHACSPPIHPYTRTFTGFNVDLRFYESVKIFIDASFFPDTHVCMLQ